MDRQPTRVKVRELERSLQSTWSWSTHVCFTTIGNSNTC